MWYSIILPIIIILSLAAIIIFIFKKAPAIKEIPTTKKEVDLSLEKKKSIWLRLGSFLISFFSSLFGRLLKALGNKIKNIFKRNKKEKKYREEREAEEDSVIERVKNYEVKKDNRDKKKIIADWEEEEIPVRPMISDKVTTPMSRGEIKDRLEDILVERIAANPKDAEAYERLGEYYLEIGNFTDSKECFKQLLKLNPMNRSARIKMQRIEREIRG